MNIETEQIFIVNSTGNQPSSASQKVFEVPVTTQVNLENVEDLSTVCRTCATVTEFLIPIFAGEGLQNNLVDKIHKHLPIQVSEQDVLPRAVCYQCAHTLLAWHELAACCEQADLALRTTLQQLQEKAAHQETKSTNSGSSAHTITVEIENKPQKESSNAIVKNILIEYLHSLNMDEDSSDLEFVCQKCSEHPASSSVGNLVQHLQSRHRPHLACRETIQEFIEEFITFDEVLTLDDPGEDVDSDGEKSEVILPKIYCPFCNNVFSSTARLVYHFGRHGDLSIERGVICCGHHYNNKNKFVEHLQENHVVQPRDDHLKTCRTCGFVAISNKHLLSHVASSHDVGTSIGRKRRERSAKDQKYIPVACPECNKMFSNKYHMLFHLKSHSQETRYSCDKCDKSYRSQASLISHRRLVHEGIMRFLCAACGEAFPTRHARDVHARLHSGEKPFHCPTCSKSYRSKQTLDRHIEMHLDIRKHPCYLCSKKFRRSTHLKYHLSTHERKPK